MKFTCVFWKKSFYSESSREQKVFLSERCPFKNQKLSQIREKNLSFLKKCFTFSYAFYLQENS